MTHIKIFRPATILLLAIASFLAGCSSVPVARGVMDGRLASCPAKDNCVSTFSTRPDQKIEPLHFTGTPAAAMEKLKAVLAKRGDNKIVQQTDHYLHVEFTTPVLRFVDDGEFLLESHEIDLRSASRIGYTDFGKNRSRLEKIRKAFEPCCG